MLSRITSRLLLLAAIALSVDAWAAHSAHDWLMRMSDSAKELNYRGHFVYQHDGQMEAMEIVHRADTGSAKERLLSLNGSPREIIRNSQGVWCYLPDEKSIMVSHHKQTDKNFPALIPMSLKQLDPHYKFSLGRKERMSGRLAQKVLIKPRDKYRYGYQLWADTKSGLLLKADLVGENGKVLEQFMFTDVQIGESIPDSALQVTVDKTGMKMHMQDGGKTKPEESAKWGFSGLPPGFMVAGYQSRMNPMKKQEMTHIILSDGLAAVSVFIETGDSKMREGRNNMGAVNAWRGQRHGSKVTVVGEVPASAIKKIVQSVRPGS